jgi:hypothetical protein
MFFTVAVDLPSGGCFEYSTESLMQFLQAVPHTHTADPTWAVPRAHGIPEHVGPRAVRHLLGSLSKHANSANPQIVHTLVCALAYTFAEATAYNYNCNRIQNCM